MPTDPGSIMPPGPFRDGMMRHAGMVGGSQVSAGLSRLVVTGRRVFTPYGVLQELKQTSPKATEASVRATFAAWLELGWLQEFVPPKGTRGCYAVTEHCPLVIEQSTLRMETILELVGAHAFYGYRTALTLHGLSEEMSDGRVIVCRPRKMVPPKTQLSFTRSQRPAQGWASWEGLEIDVSDRDAEICDHDGVSIVNGLRVTSPLRTLFDCWARPGCGVSDDRLITSWKTWLTMANENSHDRRIYDCVRMLRRDPDRRPGKLDAFLAFLQVVDEESASSFMSEWSCASKKTEDL